MVVMDVAALRYEPECLLVDDREENLFAHEALLKDTGARIRKARCGDEALDLLLRHDFAVALIDVQMPGMDGIELAETMRSIERTRSVPIIFVTAARHDESKVLRGYASGGAVDFLYKPIVPHVVRSKVEFFLELARKRRTLKANLEHAERALVEAEAARNEVTKAHELRDHLLAIVSHDLRTPLSTILLTAHLIDERPELRGNRSCIQRIIRSSERMNDIVRQMAELSRARHGDRFLVRRIELDVVELCRDVIAEIQVVHPTSTIVLQGDPHVIGTWDRGLLEQVVSNLVTNAVIHGRNTPVSVTASRRGNELVVEIHNGGPPIPEDLLPHLFDPFRSGNATPGSTSLGLGLFIAHEIVRAHGGTISVSSSEAGTHFTVRLALATKP